MIEYGVRFYEKAADVEERMRANDGSFFFLLLRKSLQRIEIFLHTAEIFSVFLLNVKRVLGWGRLGGKRRELVNNNVGNWSKNLVHVCFM
jgi:hypothetical protein